MNLAKELKKYASKDVFFYVTLDPERALGIEDILPNYRIICPYKSWLTDKLKRKGVKVLVLEEQLGVSSAEKIAAKGSYGILQSKDVKSFIESTSSTSGSDPAKFDVNILVLKTSVLIEELYKKQNWNLLAPKADIAEKFENKISQYNALKDFVNYPKTVTASMRDIFNGIKRLNYEAPTMGKGPNFNFIRDCFVLQFNRGHSGNSTFFINSLDEVERLYKLYPKREAKVSEFIKGKTYTLNCLALKNGQIATGSISEQITGLEEATNNPNTTVGNDWGSARELKKSVVLEIAGIAKNAGEVLFKNGYRGMFGIDILVSEHSEEVFFIELNTHQPASISFEAKIHRKIGKMPLIALFILDQSGGLTSRILTEKHLPSILLPINAKQIIYRNKGLKNIIRDELIKKYKEKNFLSRLYSIKPNEEVWREQIID